jgi:hypothetical protein
LPSAVCKQKLATLPVVLSHLLRRELLKDPGEVPSSPLLSGGVAPMSQPTELEGWDSPNMFLQAPAGTMHNAHVAQCAAELLIACQHPGDQ